MKVSSSNTPISQTSHSLRRPIRRVALACIQCRARKVKCDATLPTCIRCSADGKTCEYQKSRRGGRPKRPASIPLQAAVEDQPALVTPCSTEQWDDILGTTTDGQSSGSGSLGSSTQSSADTSEIAPYLQSVTLAGVQLTRTQADQLLTLYYTFFHASHPCVLPEWSLRMRFESEPLISDILLPVLLYIGSIFNNTVDSTPLAAAAQLALESAQVRQRSHSPYYIQALLLYGVAVFASNEPKRGRQLVSNAIELAIQVGMHKANFASIHGQADPVLEESWRRTWWSCHVTDASVSGSTHSFPTQTSVVQVTTELPCEEQQYETGVCLDLPTTSYNLLTRGNRSFLLQQRYAATTSENFRKWNSRLLPI